MPGLFNNETGLYEAADWLENADWFEDEEDNLYVVPLPGVVAECEGPDNRHMDAINAICRTRGRLSDADCERLGLTRIPDILKRFSPQDGYYHA